jgi:hypothetical protein
LTSLKLLRFLHRYSFEIAVTVLAGPFVFAALPRWASTTPASEVRCDRHPHKTRSRHRADLR